MTNDQHLTHHILPLTKRFVSIPSIAEKPVMLKRILEVAKKELQGYFPIEEFESNSIPSLLVHNTNKRTKHFKIILNAHLDVVPGNEEQYFAEEKDGRLYGRGTYDMKAAAAVMILLFKELANNLHYPIGLQLVTDEELGSMDTTRYQIEKGIRSDFVICGESSSNFDIVTKAKGALWVILKAKGQTAHGGYLWRGSNALLKLVDTVKKISNVYPTPTSDSWTTTVNIAKIGTTNTAFNAVPADAYAYLDIRFIHEEKETILKTIKNIISPDIEMEIVQNTLPTFLSNTNKYMKTLYKSIEKAGYQKSMIKASHATSDIRFYNEVGCLGVEFGPIGANQHGDNEWVDIKSLEDYYHILKNFLLSVKP